MDSYPDCRVAKGLFLRQRDRSLDDHTAAIGIHVPRDIFDQVKENYTEFRTRASDSLWRRLYREYPEMPPDDKTEVHRIISEQFSDPTERTVLKNLELRVHCYARDSYTPYKSLLEEKGSLNKEELDQVYERLKDTLASWRGQT